VWNAFTMIRTSFNSSWNRIATAPADAELELCVREGEDYHILSFPCRRNGVGWSDVRLNRLVPIRPTHWRLWSRERT
jgi:hypothetical protein